MQKEPTLGLYDQTFNIKWCENLKARYVLSSQSLFVKDVQKKLEWNWTVKKVIQQISLHSTTTKYCQEIHELKCTKIRRDPLHCQDYVSVLCCITFNNHRWEKLSFHSQVPPLGPVLQRYPHIQSFIGKKIIRDRLCKMLQIQEKQYQIHTIWRLTWPYLSVYVQ